MKSRRSRTGRVGRCGHGDRRLPVRGYDSRGREGDGADVYIGGCLKWLCGGPGAAFLWIDPHLHGRLRPRLTGWMSHQDPFAFGPRLVRRDDAWRFLHGTPNVSALYAARPGLEIIGRIGPSAIRRKSLRQTSRLLELADSRGLAVHHAPRPRPTRRDGGHRPGARL